MPEIGRFLAPDPAADLFAALTPYQYAFNNPITYGDPSGMVPEKNEKNRDRLLVYHNPIGGDIMNFLQQMMADFDAQREAKGWSRLAALDADFEENVKSLTKGRFGSGGDADNGQTRTLTEPEKQQIQSHVHVLVDISKNDPDPAKTLQVATDKFWEAFWKANSEMTADELDYYTHNQFDVNILNEKDFLAFSLSQGGTGEEDGWTGSGRTSETGIIKMHFPSKIFNDNYKFKDLQYYGEPRIQLYPVGYAYTVYDQNLTSAIQHEFGHGYAYYINGNAYNSWNST